MVFSGRQTIVCILLLLSLVVSARSQSAVDKAATSTISGKVTVGGKGLQGVVVALALSDQYRSNFRPTRFRSTTDEDGKYRIINVTPGTYEVIPASPAYVATEGRKSLVVGKNETVENIDIALEQGGVITGKVTDADGNPVIEEMVYVYANETKGQRAVYFPKHSHRRSRHLSGLWRTCGKIHSVRWKRHKFFRWQSPAGRCVPAHVSPQRY